MPSMATSTSSQVTALKETLDKLQKEYAASQSLQQVLLVAHRAVELCRAAALALPTSQVEAAGVTIPSSDDGTTVILRGMPKGWGVPRVKAYIERYGQKPLQVAKPDNSDWAVVVFASTDSRAAFVGKREEHQAAATSADNFRLEFPGESKPQHHQQQQQYQRAAQAGPGGSSGTKRSAGEAGAGPFGAAADAAGAGGRARKQRRTDVREAVCPLWDVPYKDQLARKLVAIQDTLKDTAKQLRARCGRAADEPAWLQGQALVCPLLGILRAPQIEGYRNKAEFTCGYSETGEPTVGFLLGSYSEGLTHVCDPSSCRHIPRAALACAAITQAFLRSSSSNLAAWDKTQHKGFWRLVVVREARATTFLPVPTYAAAAGSAGADGAAAFSSSGAAGGSVLQGSTVATVPLGDYLVASPFPAAATSAAAAAAGGHAIDSVTESEPAAPPADQLLLVVQVSPAPFGAEEVKAELQAWGEWMKAKAAEQGLPEPVLVVQVHDGVANAASADAPLMSWEQAVASACKAQQPAAEAGSITDTLCELRFRVSSTAFFQVNSAATCLLYSLVGQWAAPQSDTLLVDVCCGTGTIGISLAGRLKKVVGIDSVAEAIADAQANAALNGASNCEFVASPAEAVMEKLLAEHAGHYTSVTAVVDPPRAGLHKVVLRALLGCAAVKRLVYVSCNPQSLASNLVLLCQPWKSQAELQPEQQRGGGRGKWQWRQANKQPLEALPEYEPFQPIKAIACDLFPHTSHVESVVLLERGGA